MGKLRTQMKPLLQLYFSLSANVDSPGDVLEARLRQMDDVIHELKRKVTAGATANVKPSVFFAPGGKSDSASSLAGLWDRVTPPSATEKPVNSVAVDSGALVANLERRLAQLETDNKRMKELLDGGQVEVAGITFNVQREN